MEGNKELLKVDNLNISFCTGFGKVEALQGMSLRMDGDATVGLIGESGCGKSVLAKAIMGILPRNAEIKGSIIYKGIELLELNDFQMGKIRGKEIALIPQNPLKSLNPVLNIKTQVMETLHNKSRKYSRDSILRETIGLLKKLNIKFPETQLGKYPHQLSGGMNQRVLAAMGIAQNPPLLIADEPTKSLDAVNRYYVVKLLKNIKEALGSAILLITHDLNVAYHLCDYIGVMYRGELVEFATGQKIFNHPLHPYTNALLKSLPCNNMEPIKQLKASATITKPFTCKFYNYCPYAGSRCFREHPPLHQLSEGQMVRCFIFAKSRKTQEDLCSNFKFVP